MRFKERFNCYYYCFKVNFLFFSCLFKVLDNKAPKAEDIDEEDDDVPGRTYPILVLYECKELFHKSL